MLVGGTALALQIGHRTSIDLDFFSVHHFDENEMALYLEGKNLLTVDFITANTLKGTIQRVKVDFITHSYPLVRDYMVFDGMRLASLHDISAFKLNAIVGNGTRLKDFVDIAFLSTHLSLNDMVEAYELKYKTRNPVMPMKALAYHKDINFQEPLNLVAGKLQWDIIAGRIFDMIQSSKKIFPSVPGIIT